MEEADGVADAQGSKVEIIAIEILPQSEHKEDIPMLVEYFIDGPRPREFSGIGPRAFQSRHGFGENLLGR